MKRACYLLAALVITVAANCLAQERALLTANTQLFMHLQKQSKSPVAGFVYKQDAAQNFYVSAFIKVTNQLDEAELKDMGLMIDTKAGDIWVVQIPLDKIKALAATIGIVCIDLDRPVHLEMDSARKTTRVDSVQAGIHLPQAYSGKNVVVGIIDAGFDYTHPLFYDTLYQKYRLKKVWEQKRSGTPPAGFSYGSEWSDSAAIIARQTDLATESHGTHVAGIAAGSGFGGDSTHRQHRGIAYESDIVAIAILPSSSYWLTTGMTDMLNGIQYVFNYAEQMGKPAVVNMSWGNPLGPRDGTSLFSQALNNVVGQGKVFVLSAGNNGQNNIHLQKEFFPGDETVTTTSTFSSGLAQRVNWFDLWGESGKSFCVQLSLYNGTVLVDSTATICTSGSVKTVSLHSNNGDSTVATIVPVAVEFNGKPHILITLTHNASEKLAITITSDDGKVNMWQGLVAGTRGYYGHFTKGGLSWAVNGDNQMTISDMATSPAAISVGAYVSKLQFTNVNNQTLNYSGTLGAIASFSSRGPSANGEVKPDIAGPGLSLSSGVSSYDTPYHVGGSNRDVVTHTYYSPRNGRTYSYAMAAGTSMSSPSVAGIVALMLEANPLLWSSQVKSILQATALQDARTGTIPTGGNNIWGAGKVNAYAAVRKALTTTGIFHDQAKDNVLLFPNPSRQHSLEFVAKNEEQLHLTLLNSSGQICYAKNWFVQSGTNRTEVPTHNLPAGLYLLQILHDNTKSVVKLVVE